MAKGLDARLGHLWAVLNGDGGDERRLVRACQAAIDQMYPDDEQHRTARERIAAALFAADEGRPWPADSPPLPPMVAALVAEVQRQQWMAGSGHGMGH